MSNVSNSNIGGAAHADHIQIDDHDTVRVLCSCGTTFTADRDHSDHQQVEDFDVGLLHCECGASWQIGKGPQA